MPTRLAIPFGLVLILLGIGGYVASGAASATALIPAFLGLPIALLGWVARIPERRKHAMHAVALLSALGFAGTVASFAKLPTLMRGEAERPLAVSAQLVMAILCGVFFALCLKSFIDARRGRGSADG